MAPTKQKQLGCNGKIGEVKSSTINPLSSYWAVISILIAYSKANILLHYQIDHSNFVFIMRSENWREGGGVQYLTTKICSRKRFISPTSLQDISFKSSPCIRFYLVVLRDFSVLLCSALL